jgi:hypothetical protein
MDRAQLLAAVQRRSSNPSPTRTAPAAPQQRWGAAGAPGAGPCAVYVPEAPFPSMGTADFQNKVLRTLVNRVPSTDHPYRIREGVASPELSYFQRALQRRER